MSITIDSTKILHDYKGRPLKFDDDDMTVADAISMSCSNLGVAETLSGEQKTKGFKLSSRAYANEKLKLSAKDVSFILERSGVVNVPIVHGRLVELLDPEDAEEDEDDDEPAEPEPEGGDEPGE